jgi:hypothetical protein
MLGHGSPSTLQASDRPHGENTMFADPLKLSREGLMAMPDEELATKISDAEASIEDMKNRGIDSSVQQKVYEAYVAELERRSQSDAPTKPHGLKPVR